MKRIGQNIGQRLLAGLLCLSLVGWSMLPTMSHAPMIADVLQEHAQMIADHGHSHGLQEDLLWALHGHCHDAVDHDHSPAVAMQAQGGSHWPYARDVWHLRAEAVGPDRAFRIERPPRA